MNFKHLPKNPQTMTMNLLIIELQLLRPVRSDLPSTDAKTDFIKLDLIRQVSH